MSKRRTVVTPEGESAEGVPESTLVDTAGAEILKDLHRAERRNGKRHTEGGEAPEADAPEPEEKPRFSKQTNFFLAIGVIALTFIILFAIQLFNRPELLTPDEMHAKNLAGELDPEEGYVYNGFSFVWYDKLWFTQLHKPGTANLYNTQLHFGPNDLGAVTLGDGIEEFTVVPNTYVTFDPTAVPLTYVALAAGELSLNLAVVLNITPVPACTKNETAACAKLPIINCEEDNTHPIIFLTQGERTEVVRRGNCLTISGKEMELVKALDRVLLLWMEIMPRDGEKQFIPS